MTDIIKIQDEIKNQLSKKEVMSALVETTFKGLNQNLIPRAIMEGMMRGFEFKDFLEKNIYAIPFHNRQTGIQEYSLITSIDYARKIGMRSGVVGVSAPVYEMDGDKILSCTITIKRKVSDYVGDYTATAFFSEYNTGRNQWVSKPRTMIAKVAEMHALRKACPEELSQTYTEEEMEKEVETKVVVDLNIYKDKLEATTSLEELKQVWSALPIEAKNAFTQLKEELKAKYENK